MQRRTFLALGAAMGLASAGLLSGCQDKKTMTVVVPFAPGGGGDVLARLVLQPLGAEVGRSVVIMNRPGAGGNVGTRAVARITRGEGQFVYVTNGTLCVNKHLYGAEAGGEPFDPAARLQPVAAFTRMPLVMALKPGAIEGVTDYESLLAWGRAHPGKLACASAGVGTTSHMACALFSAMTGIALNHIPHAGGAAASKEVLAGRVPFFIDVAPNVLPLVRDSRLKALAVTSKSRSTLLPQTPALAELGLEAFDLYAWDGLAASENVPGSDTALVHDAVNRILEKSEVRQRLQKLGAEPMPMSTADFAKFIQNEGPRWENLVVKFVRPAKK